MAVTRKPRKRVLMRPRSEAAKELAAKKRKRVPRGNRLAAALAHAKALKAEELDRTRYLLAETVGRDLERTRRRH